jgi:hypothetical protein
MAEQNKKGKREKEAPRATRRALPWKWHRAQNDAPQTTKAKEPRREKHISQYTELWHTAALGNVIYWRFYRH